jgi:hypothetical protein
MWEPRRLTTLWASTVCYRDSFAFFILPSVCKFVLLPTGKWRWGNMQHVLRQMTNTKYCEMWRCQGRDYCLLGYDVTSGRTLQTSRRNLLPPSSGLNMEEIVFYETVITFRQTTRCHIWENSKLTSLSCGTHNKNVTETYCGFTNT